MYLLLLKQLSDSTFTSNNTLTNIAKLNELNLLISTTYCLISRLYY